MSGFVNEIPDGYEPVEVVVRHPDWEDDIYQYGLNHRVIYLDLGGSFDVTRIGPSDFDEVKEWVDGYREFVADLPADHPARLKVEEVIDEVLAEVQQS